jgi:hypothetical protein
VVVVRRTTPSDQVSCDFVDGSVLGEADLDANAIQALYLLQESEDDFDNSLQLDLTDDVYDFKLRRGKNLGTPILDSDAATAWWTQQWVKQNAPTLDLSGAAYDAHNHRISNLQTPILDSDAVNGFWVKAVAPTVDNSGNAYDAHNRRLTNVNTPVLDSDAATAWWVKGVAPTVDGTGTAYDAHNRRLANVQNPTSDTDAATPAWVKSYVVSHFTPVSPTDTTSVVTYGAQLDGTTDDSEAFDDARGAVMANGTIRVPEGYWKVNSTPTSGPSSPVLWQLTGNTTIEGWPIIGIGTDIVESVVEGSKYFSKSSSRPNDGPVVRVDQTINHTGGTMGNVIPAFRVNQTITNAGILNNFGWANSTILTSSARGSGEHVALAALASRPENALDDGLGPRATMWGLYVETNDLTNQAADSAGSLVGFEHDMFCNGESAFTSKRINHHMVMGRQNPTGPKARFAYALVVDNKDGGQLGFDPTDQSYLEVAIGVKMPWLEACFDASKGYSLAQAPAFKMADGMSIAFTEDNKSILRHDVGALRYYYNGAELLSVADTGQVAVAAGLQVGSTLTYTYAHIPDNPTVPANTADPMGTVGDTIFVGAYLYRKTSSGWMRVAFSTF